ncbi:cutinase family protein [Rhodococcus sp. SGAir0479]|uniref:cutinase family protein n=1 Tax=Rhodococcus sp. SGAir0479 TaxID=2567884 RepID=UPI0010CD30D5|nr:cutinase family protein [Rhodococcus sp. SGAir0479]QCQ89814.1 cutinase family protein [Rhodococcus sp. SGAir0479]
MGRRVVASAVALVTAVTSWAGGGVAAAEGAAGSADAGSTERAPIVDPNNHGAGCPDILVVAASGAGDSTADRDPFDDKDRVPWANWLGRVTVPFGEVSREQPGEVGWTYVPYPATFGLGVFADVPTYQDSVATGVASLNRILDEKKAQCGDATRFVLLGYSVGAEITERVARDIGRRAETAAVTAADVAGVALVGDPYRPAGTPSLGEPGPAGGGFMSSEPADYGALEGRILYACRPMDISCDAPPDIALLELALGVLGQMRFTIANPVQTFADFGRVASQMSARAIAHIVTREDWFTSDESLLDVLRTVADQTYRDDAAARDATPERVAAVREWALGAGADVVRAKLAAEGAGFVDDNRGIVDLVLKPYLVLGPLQHVLYWEFDANDPWRWDSERVADWIGEVAAAERARGADPAAPHTF